jgi:ligand-binding SRPBCC domain-containing protein
MSALYKLERSATIPAPRDEVFAFFSDPHNLARITPRSLGLKITYIDTLPVGPGFRIVYTVKPLFGVPVKWVTRITVFDPPHLFVDVQEQGPYRSWRHEHTFENVNGHTLMRDRIEYDMPLGLIGDVVQRLVVASQLQKIFEHRTRKITRLFAASAPVAAVPGS